MPPSRLLNRSFAALMFFLLSSNFGRALGDATAPLKQILNGQGYILISPAESWPYAGGLLVAKGKNSATFVDLPSSVSRPAVQSPLDTIDFPAMTVKKQFSLKLILTGLSSILGGNPGFGIGSNKSLTFKELKAQAQRLSFEDARTIANSVAKSPELKDDLSSWLGDKNTQVFVIGVIATTTAFSVSADNNFNADLSFNGTLGLTCPGGTSSDPSQAKSAQTATTPGQPAQKPTAQASNTSQNQSTPGATQNNQKSSTASSATSTAKTAGNPTPAAASVPAGPGGELHYCFSSENTLSMQTDKPLAFAAGAYRMSKNGTGGIELEPIFSITPGGRAESTSHVQRASAISPRWTRRSDK